MAVDPDALKRFLEKRGPKLPDVKSMSAEECLSLIERVTRERPRFVTEPRLPQLQGLALAVYVERVLLFYDMRMGKTKLALDWASHLGLCGRWRGKGIIIPPSPIITDVWVKQAQEHSVLKIVPCGPKFNDLLKALESDADMVAIALPSLSAMFSVKRMTKTTKGKPGRPKLFPDYEMLDALSPMIELAIFDEIHKAKQHDGLWFRIAAAATADARFRLGLTGTPWGRDPFAAWAEAFLIDRGETLGRNYYFFEMAFGHKVVNFAAGGRTEYKFDKKKLPILQEKLASISISARRKDQGVGVFQGAVDLDLHGDQRKAYQNAINQLIELPAGNRGEIKSTFIRLRQIASGYLPFKNEWGQEQVVTFQQNAKLEWLRDFMANLDPKVKCVFFHEFIPTGQRICQELEKAKVSHVWLHGETKDKPGTVAHFESGKSRVIVCNAASGGMGIELLSADYKCFVESPLSAIIREQAERRAQGEKRGDRPLIIDDLLCAPVERRILEMVREGKDTLGALYKDHRSFAERLKL